MRTHAKPQPLSSAIEWMKRRGATHLYLIVDPERKQAIKIGAMATLTPIYQSEDGESKGWQIMAYSQAKAMVDDDTPRVEPLYQPDGDEMVHADPVAKPAPAPLPAGSEAQAIVALIRSIAGDAINEEQVRAIVDERLASWDKPQATMIEIVQPDQPEPIAVGTVHNRFPDLLKACSARDMDGNRLNILLVGPAGTSKSTAARQAAKALNLPFYPMAAVESKYELLGFIDANGNATETVFKKGWRDGGVISMDELSAFNEGAVLAVNGCLATGIAPFPDGAIERHPDCVVICSDNVFGAPNAQYNARNKLDDAFMDRFIKIDWPIDEALELAITGNDSWVETVRRIRKAIADKGIRGVMITPRASLYGAALIRAGMDIQTVARMTCQKSMTEEQWNEISYRVF